MAEEQQEGQRYRERKEAVKEGLLGECRFRFGREAKEESFDGFGSLGV